MKLYFVAYGDADVEFEAKDVPRCNPVKINLTAQQLQSLYDRTIPCGPPLFATRNEANQYYSSVNAAHWKGIDTEDKISVLSHLKSTLFNCNQHANRQVKMLFEVEAKQTPNLRIHNNGYSYCLEEAENLTLLSASSVAESFEAKDGKLEEKNKPSTWFGFSN